MAPVPPRTLAPLNSRPSLLAPSTPARVSAFIPRKLFLQLFAGTVCIFILAVVFWKFPRFFRWFTKGKVLREGNNTTTRYVKTWYGWVPSHQHETNKRRLKSCMTMLGRMTAWRSSKADFRWAWWDPGQKELGTYQESGKRWLPKWARSYSFTTADAMWNPGHPPSREIGIINSPVPASVPLATGALLPPDAPRSVATLGARSRRTNTSLQESLCGAFSARGSIFMAGQRRCAEITLGFGSNTSSPVFPYLNKPFTSLRQLPLLQSTNCIPFNSAARRPSVLHSCSMPCLPRPVSLPARPGVGPNVAYESEKAESEDLGREPFLVQRRRSRKYQVWSARMGLQTLKCIGYSTHTLPRGPPGSPETALLGNVSFASTGTSRPRQYRGKSKQQSSSDISDLLLGGSEQRHNVERCSALMHGHKGEADVPTWRSAPLLRGRPMSFQRPSLLLCLKDSQEGQQNSAGRTREIDKKQRHRSEEKTNTKRKASCLIQVKDWSNWEVRLIYHLYQRLQWLSVQLSPGRRPYHFALLANHWLNKETWFVYDPISRVPIDMRRRLGDPRFNVPYSLPTWAPKHKYPKSHHRPALTPRINSWRAAVNRHRRALGLKEFIKGIELYDSSAEDTPDGRIDPGSYILRKPPQGFDLSARQKERYYEGGAGWQEKLSDWEKIRRGYRVRKAIYEGRVNRTRAKEFANGVGRYCKYATSRFFRSKRDSCRRDGKLWIDELC
ncbi:hypothetical protein BJX61DRAFT_75763 [Aspergillus egyptiacus]|nr:hypothetical protein BJX61DRAFT_75763 [Aspergillus egyptiacus]